MKPITSLLLCILIWMQAAVANAEYTLDLDTINIKGNVEMPRIVYLTGWRKPPKGDILQQTLEKQHSDEISALDRDVLRRQINYYRKLEQLRD